MKKDSGRETGVYTQRSVVIRTELDRKEERQGGRREEMTKQGIGGLIVQTFKDRIGHCSYIA